MSLRRLFIYWLTERLYWQLQKLGHNFTSADADLSTAIGNWQQKRNWSMSYNVEI